MKAIMISIRPEWVEKILNREKTIEIRKTKPNCDLPIKCYIYCTKPRRWFVDSPFTMFSYEKLWIQDGKIYNGKDDSLWNPDFNHYHRLNGRVVAEFTLNKVKDYAVKNEGFSLDWGFNSKEDIMNLLKKSCLDGWGVSSYIGDNNHLSAWYIDDLKIYNEPKELSEFYVETIDDDCCVGCPYHETEIGEEPCKNCYGNRKYITRPPQSWCYVEELEAKWK